MRTSPKEVETDRDIGNITRYDPGGVGGEAIQGVHIIVDNIDTNISPTARCTPNLKWGPICGIGIKYLCLTCIGYSIN